MNRFNYTLFFVVSTYCMSAQTEFFRPFNTDGYEDARSLAIADEGCFVFTGLDKSAGDTLGDAYLAKMNSVGMLVWKQYYGLPGEDGGNHVIATLDGGFLMSGHTNNTSDVECDGYVVKTDRDGNALWKLQIGTVLDEVFTGVVQDSDGSFYFTGRYESPQTALFDVLLAKVTSDGKLVFLKGIPYDGDEFGTKIALSPDNNLYICGYAKGGSEGIKCMHALKCDKEGNSIWQKSICGATDYLSSFIIPIENGCIFGGGSLTNSGNIEEARVVKVNHQGEIIALKNFTSAQEKMFFRAGSLTENGNFLLTAQKHLVQEDKNTIASMIFDADLNLISTFESDILPEATLGAAIPISECELMTIGKYKSSTNNTDVFAKRFNCGTIGEPSPKQIPIIAFPNPATDFIYISFVNSFFTATDVAVYDNLGKLIFRESAMQTQEYMLIRQKNMPFGVYHYIFSNKNTGNTMKGCAVFAAR